MSSTALKLIALALMLADHIAEFIPGAPVWLHWLGRASAPLFLFCTVWGFSYTRDKRRYLWRMYFFGCGMAVMDLLCNNLAGRIYQPVVNNIFVMLLLVCMLCGLAEEGRTGAPAFRRHLALFLVLQAGSTLLCLWAGGLPLAGADTFAGALLPNLIFCEGSTRFVMLGVGLYLFKERPGALAAFYGLFCLMLASAAVRSYGAPGLLRSYQWMMIFALPLMLCYNGKKGAGLKYLFYVFYPAHILLLFLLGNRLAG